jgi:hypothetical protein
VTADRKRWKAQIYYDNKSHSLGSFGTKQEAALAYDREARQCGKDKPLNYENIRAAEEAAVQAHEAHAAHTRTLAPSTASGFHGVRASKKRWQAYIYYDNKSHSLGTFDTKQEAALAYDRAARQCKKDKPLNYESSKAAEEAARQARR